MQQLSTVNSTIDKWTQKTTERHCTVSTNYWAPCGQGRHIILSIKNTGN